MKALKQNLGNATLPWIFKVLIFDSVVAARIAPCIPGFVLDLPVIELERCLE